MNWTLGLQIVGGVVLALLAGIVGAVLIGHVLKDRADDYPEPWPIPFDPLDG